MNEKAEIPSTNVIIPTNRDENKAELEQLILRCIVMRFSERESLAYIAENYKKIESTRYYEIKRTLADKLVEEGYRITSKNGLYEQHMMRIQTLETIEKEQWKLYKAEPKPFLKSSILERIQNLQVYLSSAYDYIRAIIKNQEDLQLIIAKHGAKELEAL